MIKVDICRNKDKNVYAFTLEGHAGYEKSGKDIVCASVSFLVINTINCIEKFTDAKIEYTMAEEGHLKCILPQVKEGMNNHDVDLLINAMVFGLKDLTKQYGKYIHINDREV